MILRVQPIEGEMFRFWVDSISRPEAPHLVDLESYHWGGQCDCEAFKFRHEPQLSRGAKPDDKLRCSHIKAARSYFIDELLPRIAASIKRLSPTPTIAMEAEAIVTTIQNQDKPDQQKINELMSLRSHLDATVEQIQSYEQT